LIRVRITPPQGVRDTIPPASQRAIFGSPQAVRSSANDGWRARIGPCANSIPSLAHPAMPPILSFVGQPSPAKRNTALWVSSQGGLSNPPRTTCCPAAPPCLGGHVGPAGDRPLVDKPRPDRRAGNMGTSRPHADDRHHDDNSACRCSGPCPSEFGIAAESSRLPCPGMELRWYGFAVCCVDRRPVRATEVFSPTACPDAWRACSIGYGEMKKPPEGGLIRNSGPIPSGLPIMEDLHTNGQDSAAAKA
jgi:hypothetical protein